MLDTLLFYLGLSLLIQLIFFIPAFILKTDIFTDMTYGLTFIILTLYTLFTNQITDFTILLTVMILIWAIRLGGFLAYRIHKMKKDKRFDGVRENFLKFGKFWLLQGIAVWIILVNTFLFMSNQVDIIFWVSLIGFIIWILGFSLETTADLQKFKWSCNPKNKGKWIDVGVWSKSRHPNYMGEMMCWSGIYLFTFSLTTISIYSIVSPLFIILLLRYGSGVPMLEEYADKKWGNNKKYQEYKKNTPMLIPKF